MTLAPIAAALCLMVAFLFWRCSIVSRRLGDSLQRERKLCDLNDEAHATIKRLRQKGA